MPRLIPRALVFLAVVLVSTASTVGGRASAQEQQRCFDETGFCISGRFLEFWQQNGGLAVFGYPLTPARQETNADGDPVVTQYFERQRFELHPENDRSYDVLLGRLGAPMVAAADPPIFREREAGPKPGCMWFEQTGFNVCNEQGFASYWRNNGLRSPQLDSYQQSLALFGYPISRLAPAGPGGSPSYVQYFERARFEYHPNNPSPYKVLLGRLGAQTLFPQPEQAGTGRIAFVKNDGLYTMNVDGSNQQRILAPDALGSPLYLFSEPEWSPDATKIAFTAGLVGDTPPSIYVVNADGSHPREIADDATNVRWSPEGTRVVFSSYTSPRLTNATSAIVVANADGSNARALTRTGRFAFDAAWSPDGSQIAYLVAPSDHGLDPTQLYAMNADGSNQRQLSQDGSGAFDWSPNGAKIVFSSIVEETNASDLFAVSLNNANVTRLTNTPQFEETPRWSSNGAQIAFVRVPAAEPTQGQVPNSDIYAINADGSGERALVINPEGAVDPVWITGSSVPNLLYQTFHTESQGIYRLVGQESTRLADGYNHDFIAR